MREFELEQREAELKMREKELAALKEHYIEQGKDVILEAKRRADGITAAAQQNAEQITAEAEQNRDSVYIKARAEGFEQGRKDGVEAVRADGQDILAAAKEYSDRINAEKDALFEKYEKEIYETVMAIANKVTLDSMAVKDGTAAKRLIKKAAKEFRNSQLIRIRLDKNGATETLAGDYEYLKELCGGIAQVEVELIPDAEAGTVIVDNGSEITDAGIQTQLRMIQELGNGKFRAGSGKKKASGGRRKKADKAENPEAEEAVANADAEEKHEE
jgi:flagellar biosynthesis/type III secretory pathway protein FliH